MMQDRAREQADVVVVGAGFAGLTAEFVKKSPTWEKLPWYASFEAEREHPLVASRSWSSRAVTASAADRIPGRWRGCLSTSAARSSDPPRTR